MRVELDYPTQMSLTEGQYLAEISQRDVEKRQWIAEQLAGQQKAFKGHGPTRQPQTPQALEKKGSEETSTVSIGKTSSFLSWNYMIL